MVECSHHKLYFFFVLHPVCESAMVCIAAEDKFFSNVVEYIMGDRWNTRCSGKSYSFEWGIAEPKDECEESI